MMQHQSRGSISTYPTLLEPVCRRRLPPTPTRRSSSPRILPTPPPLSPDYRCPSSAATLERKPSGRMLPRFILSYFRKKTTNFNFRPPSQTTPEIAPSYSPNESVSPDISLEPTTPDPILTPDPVIEFIPNGNAYPEANSPCQMTNGHGSMLDFTAPVRSGSGILERRLTETPDEGVRSQSSSLSPSIEQVSPSRIIGYHVLFYLLCYRYHHLVWLLWTPAGKLLSNIKLSVCVLLAEVRQLACHFSAPPCFCLISLSSYLFYLPSEKRARVTTVVKRKEIEISRGICAFSGF